MNTSAPLRDHIYTGLVPPLTPAAVNRTSEPIHTVSFGVTEMLTDVVYVGITAIVSAAVAIAGTAQAALLVSVTFTISPFEGK